MALLRRGPNKRFAPRAKSRFGRKPRRNGRAAPGPSRTYASNVLTQGVGAVPAKAWGGTDSFSLMAWDAKLPQHLPLPRAVGPYTTIRATRRVNTLKHCNIVGVFQQGQIVPHEIGNWTETVMLSSMTSSDPINHPSNVLSTNLELSGLGGAATLCPSALSVQIMCPTALDAASGIIYVGCMNTQPDIAGRTETWTSYFDKFVQFQSPRLLSAGKLVLRGVQTNSYPLNMAEVSKFTTLDKTIDAEFTFAETELEPKGWAPIMIYNPQGASLELLITVEYRLRFDLDHPASASHSHHRVAPDSVWDRLMTQAVALGNGVIDIADCVATTGNALSKAANAYRAVRPLAIMA